MIAIYQYCNTLSTKILTSIYQYAKLLIMGKKKRIHYNTTLDVELLKNLKFLSIEENKRHNDLLEEAIQDLLKKYAKKAEE